MKRTIAALAVVFTIIFVSGNVSAAQDTKIVYIDSQRILYESAPGKEAYKQLSAAKDQKEAEVIKKRNKLKSLSESLQAKSATMSAQAKDDLSAQYDREMKDYERFVKDAQEDLRSLEKKLLMPWSKELDEIIKTYGAKNGIDLILDKTNPVIIYASDKIDITNPIMDALNKKYQEKAKAKK
jgi:outer membrane protein